MAEEVTQDVFLQVWKHREQLPAIENPDDWIFIIARNQAYTAIKKQLRDEAWLKHIDTWLGIELDAPDKELLLKESRALLEKAALTLPGQQSEVFRLSRIEELSIDEIAEKLQISRHTVKYHLTKALAGVRAYIAIHGDGLALFLCMVRLL